MPIILQLKHLSTRTITQHLLTNEIQRSSLTFNAQKKNNSNSCW
uniref:Uncharacterized protein n=1 Tax=Arundo donax TaxID=35708 RepID=A0A0A9HML7_ARUDO